MPIEAIAERSGYGGVAAFSRAFTTDYGMPPAQYRKEGAHAKFHAEMNADKGDAFEVAIRELPSLQLAAIDHVGSYMQIGRAFEPLFGRFAARGLAWTHDPSIGVYYDDPFSVPRMICARAPASWWAGFRSKRR